MVSYQFTEAVTVTLLRLGRQISKILNHTHFRVGIIGHHVHYPKSFRQASTSASKRATLDFCACNSLVSLATCQYQPFRREEDEERHEKTWKKTYENEVKSSNIIQHPILHLCLTPRSKTPLVDVPWPLHPHQSLPALWRLSPDKFSFDGRYLIKGSPLIGPLHAVQAII